MHASDGKSSVNAPSTDVKLAGAVEQEFGAQIDRIQWEELSTSGLWSVQLPASASALPSTVFDSAIASSAHTAASSKQTTETHCVLRHHLWSHVRSAVATAAVSAASASTKESEPNCTLSKSILLPADVRAFRRVPIVPASSDSSVTPSPSAAAASLDSKAPAELTPAQRRLWEALSESVRVRVCTTAQAASSEHARVAILFSGQLFSNLQNEKSIFHPTLTILSCV
jgi:hypothetical protein